MYGVKKASKIKKASDYKFFFFKTNKLLLNIQSRPPNVFSILIHSVLVDSWPTRHCGVDHTEATIFLLHATQGTWGKFSPPLITTLLSCLLVQQAIIISWLDYCHYSLSHLHQPHLCLGTSKMLPLDRSAYHAYIL